MATETTQSEPAVNKSFDEKMEVPSVEKPLVEADKLKSLDNSTPPSTKDEKIGKKDEILDVKKNGTSNEQIIQNERIFIEQTLNEPDMSKAMDYPVSDLKEKGLLKEEETPDVKGIKASNEQETLGAMNETMEKQMVADAESPKEVNGTFGEQETVEITDAGNPRETDSIEVAKTETQKESKIPVEINGSMMEKQEGVEIADTESPKESDFIEVAETEFPKETKIPVDLNGKLEKQESADVSETQIPEETDCIEVAKTEIPKEMEPGKVATPREQDFGNAAGIETPKEGVSDEAAGTEISKEQDSGKVAEIETPKEEVSDMVSGVENPKEQESLEGKEYNTSKELDGLNGTAEESLKDKAEVTPDVTEESSTEKQHTSKDTPKEDEKSLRDAIEESMKEETFIIPEFTEESAGKKQETPEALEKEMPKEDESAHRDTIEESMKEEVEIIPDVTEESSAKKQETTGAIEKEILKEEETTANRDTMEESMKEEVEIVPHVSEEMSAKKQETPEAIEKEVPIEEETSHMDTIEKSMEKEAEVTRDVSEQSLMKQQEISKALEKELPGTIEEGVKEETKVTPNVPEETPEATQEETLKKGQTSHMDTSDESSKELVPDVPLDTNKDHLPLFNENASKVEGEKLSKEVSETAETGREMEVKTVGDREIPNLMVDQKSGAGVEGKKTENVPSTTLANKAKTGTKFSLRRSTAIFRNIGSKMTQVMQKMKNSITRKSSNERATTKQAS